MTLVLSSSFNRASATGGGLSLNTKICAAATVLVLLSLAITASVIGYKSSDAAEAASLNLARTSAREAAGALQTRISANLSSVTALAGAMSSRAANPP